MPSLPAMLAKAFFIVWAAPYSLLGASIGLIGLLSGGTFRLRHGAIECYGGFTRWLVAHLPPGPRTAAMTLGHVIIGQSAESLDAVAYHERVHVRQFERWGPLMGPAYLLASAWLYVRGGDYYRDNPFEIEAYRKESEWLQNKSQSGTELKESSTETETSRTITSDDNSACR